MPKYIAEKPVPFGELEKLLAANGGKGWELVTVVGHVGELYMTVWKVPAERQGPQMGKVGGR